MEFIQRSKIKSTTAFFFLIAMLCTAFVFWNATRTGEESKALSNSITDSIKDKIENENHVPPMLEGTDAIYSKDPQSEGENQVSVNDYYLKIFVRKTAHLLEYTFLTFFLSLALVSYGIEKDKTFIIAFFYSAVISSFDELIQSFTEGRSGRIKDVFIDICGGIMGIFLAICVCLLFYYWIKRLKNTPQ